MYVSEPSPLYPAGYVHQEADAVPNKTTNVASAIFLSLAAACAVGAFFTASPLLGITAVVALVIGLICLAPSGSPNYSHTHTTSTVYFEPEPTYFGPAPYAGSYPAPPSFAGSTYPAPPSYHSMHLASAGANGHGAGYSAIPERGTPAHVPSYTQPPASSHINYARPSGNSHGGGRTDSSRGTPARATEAPPAYAHHVPGGGNSSRGGTTAFPTRK